MNLEQSLGSETLERIFAPLDAAQSEFAKHYTVSPPGRQPVHTVYGGAQLFTSRTVGKLQQLAATAFHQYCQSPATLADVFSLRADLAEQVHALVDTKLKRQAVEDYRIDFEDGYGHRGDEEEDGHAAGAAREMANAMKEGLLPPFSGFRTKGLTEGEVRLRAARTLDIFLTNLLAQTEGALPENFVVTLPKVSQAAQVTAFGQLLSALESRHQLSAGSIKIELMIETPQAFFDQKGSLALPALLSAAQGRCRGVHLGAYDYTAALEIAAPEQKLDQPACDLARALMQMAFAGTGVWLSDGATNVMPIPLHRAATGDGAPALSAAQLEENTATVHNAWRLSFRHVTGALKAGFYQGWDLHPNQIPVRYIAAYAFFLSNLDSASARLKNFVDQAARATLIADMFDDAASGQGLLNFFLRAVSCGALSEEQQLQATGLSREEIETRSFLAIVKGRQRRDGPWI